MSDVAITVNDNAQNILVQIQESGFDINLVTQQVEQNINVIVGPPEGETVSLEQVLDAGSENILVQIQENNSDINLVTQQVNQDVNVIIGSQIGVQGPRGDKGDKGEKGDITDSLGKTFEIISQNILDYGKTFHYDYDNGGILTQIDYSLSGENIYKKFTYSGDNLILCSLSGNSLSGVNINKSFLYNLSGDLDSINYSF